LKRLILQGQFVTVIAKLRRLQIKLEFAEADLVRRLA
jgi:hypothetical protein